MGLFKKQENATQSAYAQAAAVQSTDVDPGDPVLEPIEGVTVERYAGLTSEAEVDAWAVQQGLAPGDPFAPIEGVDIDTYARVQGLIGKNMIMGPENVENFAAENGIPKGTWQAVVLGWQERIQKYPQVQQRFGVVLSQHAL